MQRQGTVIFCSVLPSPAHGKWFVREKGHSAQENRCGPYPSDVLFINKEQSRFPEGLGVSVFITDSLRVVCSEASATDSRLANHPWILLSVLKVWTASCGNKEGWLWPSCFQRPTDLHKCK